MPFFIFIVAVADVALGAVVVLVFLHVPFATVTFFLFHFFIIEVDYLIVFRSVTVRICRSLFFFLSLQCNRF